MKKTSTPMVAFDSQTGAALPVGLILLLILTLLGVAGMNNARMQLQMSGGLQNHEYAYQSAEAGLSLALATETLSIGLDTGDKPFAIPAAANDSASGTYRMVHTGAGPVPSGGFTVGSVVAQHFRISSTAQLASNNQAETHVQGLFLISPAN